MTCDAHNVNINKTALSFTIVWYKCKSLASTVHEIWRDPKNFKSRSRHPFAIPFDVILRFFYSAACTESVCEIWREYLHWWPIYGYFTISPIWLQNAYFRPFWGGLSVCLSNAWIVTERKKVLSRFSFLNRKMVGGGDPSAWNFRSKWPY